MLVSTWCSDLLGVELARKLRRGSDCDVTDGGNGLCRHVSPSNLDKGGECRGIAHSELGQHATVDLDLGGLQTLDETVVGHPIGARAGIDPLDPEATEVTLACATVR